MPETASPGLSQADVLAIMAPTISDYTAFKASVGAIPQPATSAPPQASTASAKGSSALYALADHTHGERTKWVGTAQQTNSSGVWTKTLPANLLVNSPGTWITVRMAAGSSYIPSIVVIGTAAAGFTITVTFVKLAATIAVLGGSLTVASAGVVTFDIGFCEPDQVGN